MSEKKHFQNITQCRICGNTRIQSLFHLGEMALSGVFPRSRDFPVTSGPIELVKCIEDDDINACGLVQLRQTYNLNEMYGNHYGYRSSLNPSMVKHLQTIVAKTFPRVRLLPDDLIIDIGSNDGTLLKSYPETPATLLGIDPLINKFLSFYPQHIKKIPDFFSSTLFQKNFGNQKAKIITSIAMFYDLESPMDFVRNIIEVLHDEGVWVFEQSYMPFMIERNAYDTICHEHLEYYGLKQIMWMLDKAGLKLIDVDFNETNGGSFLLTAAKKDSSHKESRSIIREILEKEEKYQTISPFIEFKQKIEHHRDELLKLLRKIKSENKKVFGYGASTKGNILLQYCGLSPNELDCMAEVNEEKYNAFTPNTWIPIIPEKKARELKPDYFLVLPWHFKSSILKKEAETLRQGIRFIFPLPQIEVV